MRNKKFVQRVCLFLAILMVLSVLISVLASVGALGVSQSEIDSLEEEKAAIAELKEGVSSTIANLEAQQATVLETKAALDEKNELARQEIELINEQIALYDDMIAEKEIELEEAIALEEYQKERFRSRLREMEENSEMSYVVFAMQADGFSDLLTRVDNVTEIIESDAALEAKYIAAREEVQTVKAEYEIIQADQLLKREELEARKAQLEIEIAEAAETIAQLQEDIDKFKAEYEANEAAIWALQSQINEMTEEFNRQQEEAKQQGQTVVVGTGSLGWPTPGSTLVTSPFGWRIHPIFQTEKYHSGIDVAANEGTPIYAADSGTVQTAVYSSSYGNYVVINHGNTYTTLYAHMSSMAVSQGQTVNKGDVIGYVGSTGWSTGPHLHYEISYGGANIDPEAYYGNLTVAY